MADSAWCVFALDALDEGFRVIAHGLNVAFAERNSGARIDAEPMRRGDDLKNATEAWRQALRGLRANGLASPDDGAYAPWFLRDLLAPTNPMRKLVAPDGWSNAKEVLMLVVQQLRKDTEPERWPKNIVKPVERYHAQWHEQLDRIKRALRGDSKGEGAGRGSDKLRSTRRKRKPDPKAVELRKEREQRRATDDWIRKAWAKEHWDSAEDFVRTANAKGTLPPGFTGTLDAHYVRLSLDRTAHQKKRLRALPTKRAGK